MSQCTNPNLTEGKETKNTVILYVYIFIYLFNFKYHKYSNWIEHNFWNSIVCVCKELVFKQQKNYVVVVEMKFLLEPMLNFF